jgi:hypothetical protein
MFFIGFPLLFISCTVCYILIFLWDYKLGIKFMRNHPYSYEHGGEWDDIKIYTTGWHWLLGLPHYKEEEGIMIHHMRKLQKRLE